MFVCDGSGIYREEVHDREILKIPILHLKKEIPERPVVQA
jgi:hypothetical protein